VKHGIISGNIRPRKIQGKSDGPRFASRPCCAQSLRVGRARRGVRRFLNAASDRRGFVKAELARPNGVLLEVPGLQSTPALGKAVFDYQFVPTKRRGE